MKHIFAILLCCTLFTASIFAQEEQKSQDPITVVFSQNKVKMGSIGDLTTMVKEKSGPIMNEVVEAGHWLDWTLLSHDWGDEWNFNFMYSAKSKDAFFKGWDMFVSKMGEKYPDAFQKWQAHVLEHKDNVYVIRSGATNPTALTTPSTTVLSQNLVRSENMGALMKMIKEMSGPVMDEVVKGGDWKNWGVLTHNWGDEWNFNIYYIAESKADFLAGWSKFVKLMTEKNGDSFQKWQELIIEHKDNIYVNRLSSYSNW